MPRTVMILPSMPLYQLIEDGLRSFGKTQGMMFRSIVLSASPSLSADELSKASKALKEKYRRLKDRPEILTLEHPMFHDFVGYFQRDEKMRPFARVLKHIYRQQAYDMQVLAIPSLDGPYPRELIEWFVFPPYDESTLTKHIEDWNHTCKNGHAELYRSTATYYKLVHDSPLHFFVRRALSLDLARVAITFGDYRFAYMVANRLCIAFESKFTSIDRARSELVQQYLLATQIRATSVSHIFFFGPYTSSAELYDKAHRVLQESHALIHAGKLKISAIEMKRLMLMLFIRQLRGMTRTLFTKDFALLSLDKNKPVVEKLISQAEALLTAYENVKPIDEDTFTAHDTLARAYSLFEIAGDNGRTRAKLHAKKSLDICSALYSQGMPHLLLYRQVVTHCILLCRQIVSTDDVAARQALASEAHQAIHAMVVKIGSDRLLHTRTMIQTINRLIDESCLKPSDMSGFSFCGSSPTRIEPTMVAARLSQIETESGSLNALYFDTPFDSELLAQALELSWAARKKLS